MGTPRPADIEIVRASGGFEVREQLYPESRGFLVLCEVPSWDEAERTYLSQNTARGEQ
mgnify:FL=1